MFEIVLESLQFLVLAGALALFVHADKSVSAGRRGFLLIKIGFLLILFGVFMGITSRMDIPGWAMVGGIKLQVLLEKLVGHLAGAVLLLLGLWYWLPSMKTMEEVQDELDRSRRELEKQFLERNRVLENEISKRRKAETAFRLAEERRMMMYENSPVGITHGYVGGKYIQRNRAYARMLGYESPEEMVKAQAEEGNSFSHFVDAEDIDRLLSMGDTGESARGLLVRMRRKDGKLIWVQLDTETLVDRNGESYYFFAFASDVTDRKESADAIARSEQRLKVILRAMPVGIFLVDLESQTFMDVNQAALRMIGYERDELVGAPCRGILYHDPEEYFQGACDKDFICVTEGTVTGKDGGRLPVLKTSVRASVHDRDCLIESLMDMSEQKRLEELRADVDRIVAHDLKSPIIGVINGCRVLLMEEERIDGEVREMLKLIEYHGEKALKMLGMSLVLYRMEAGTFEYVPDSVDILEIVRAVCLALEDPHRSKIVTMAASLDGVPVTEETSLVLPGNDLLLETVVANLLHNAVDACPDGGHVDIALESGESVVLTISNPGAVPGDIRENFFDKYSTQGKLRGTGLGTYSARLVILAMGGDIFMETSDEEDRTVITVRLPGA